MNAVLSAEVVKDRRPVWAALSEFWLDTELQEFQLKYIAKVCATSPYSLSEIKAIHFYEVAPAVSINALSPAGAWSGFESEWLFEQCARNAMERRHLLWRARQWFRRPMFWFFTSSYWRQVVPAFKALRQSAAQEIKKDIQ